MLYTYTNAILCYRVYTTYIKEYKLQYIGIREWAVGILFTYRRCFIRGNWNWMLRAASWWRIHYKAHLWQIPSLYILLPSYILSRSFTTLSMADQTVALYRIILEKRPHLAYTAYAIRYFPTFAEKARQEICASWWNLCVTTIRRWRLMCERWFEKGSKFRGVS